MAIKVSGTTVIDDSRGLINIASVDATTATAITEAGVGGGGTHEFVASGAISTGDVVALNSDGTVSVVAQETAPSVVGSQTLGTLSPPVFLDAVYDTNSNKVVVVFVATADYSTWSAKAVVGTVSGNTISFGTEYTITGSAGYRDLAATFDSVNNKVVAVFRDQDNSSYGTALVGTVSGTTISFGSPVVFNSAYTSDLQITFDSNAGKAVVVCRDYGLSSYGTARVGTVSGTSISFGDRNTFNAATTAIRGRITFDSVNNKVVIAYWSFANSPSESTIISGTVSGTSVSFDTPAIFDSYPTTWSDLAFDTQTGQVIIAYSNTANYTFFCRLADVSGSTVSFGPIASLPELVFAQFTATYDASVNRVAVFYNVYASNILKMIVGTVSGTSISFGSPVVIQSDNSSVVRAVYDSSNNKNVVAYNTNSDLFSRVISTGGNLLTNASSYIGVAAEDIADTATGEVTIIGGVNEQTVNSYDLANASYDGVSFSIAAQDTTPVGLFFKPDGTKMYILGEVGDDVNEYDLSTAWDISTASYLQNFSVGAQENDVQGLFFKPDGLKMYIIGRNGDDVNEYNLSTAWNISTASFLQNFSVAAQDGQVFDVFFKPDGTVMYVLGRTGNTIYEYNLSTAWNVSTASYLRNTSVTAQEGDPAGLFFKPDGTKMYVSGVAGDDINEYNLSTAWNVSTASFIRNFSVAAQGLDPSGLFFKPDGTKMYVLCDSSADTVYQYSTGTFGGFTINTSYFVADDGSLTTTNNGRKIGKALSATELQVKTKLTGSEMNEYLGGLV